MVALSFYPASPGPSNPKRAFGDSLLRGPAVRWKRTAEPGASPQGFCLLSRAI